MTRSEAYYAKRAEYYETCRIGRELLPHCQEQLDKWFQWCVPMRSLAEIQYNIDMLRFGIVQQLAADNFYIYEFCENHFRFHKEMDSEHVAALFRAMPILLRLQFEQMPTPAHLM